MKTHGPLAEDGKCCLHHRLQRWGWSYSNTAPVEHDRRRVIAFSMLGAWINLQYTLRGH